MFSIKLPTNPVSNRTAGVETLKVLSQLSQPPRLAIIAFFLLLSIIRTDSLSEQTSQANEWSVAFDLQKMTAQKPTTVAGFVLVFASWSIAVHA